jgi:hypothetical protein
VPVCPAGSVPVVFDGTGAPALIGLVVDKSALSMIFLAIPAMISSVAMSDLLIEMPLLLHRQKI